MKPDEHIGLNPDNPQENALFYICWCDTGLMCVHTAGASRLLYLGNRLQPGDTSSSLVAPSNGQIMAWQTARLAHTSACRKSSLSYSVLTPISARQKTPNPPPPNCGHLGEDWTLIIANTHQQKATDVTDGGGELQIDNWPKTASVQKAEGEVTREGTDLVRSACCWSCSCTLRQTSPAVS